MNKTNSIFNKVGIPDTHNFVYRNKIFPFKFDFFKYCSNFFSANQENLLSSKNINLVDKDAGQKIYLSDDSIKDFINYVQCNEIQLNNDNIITLNYLSKKYEIQSLIEDTEEYISKNHQELIIQILLSNQKDPQFEFYTYEDIISANLVQYVNDEKLISLNFSILYNIMTKYQLKIEGKEKMIKEDKIIDFLFKCLDKYGRSASVLFTHVDFCESRGKYLERLLNGYSEIFDFHFINFSIVKVIFEMKKELDQNQKENKESKQMIQELNTKLSDSEREKKDESQKLNQKITDLQKDRDIFVSEKNRKENEMKNEIQKLNQKITDLQKDKDIFVSEKNRKENEMKNEIQKLKEEIEKLKEKERHQIYKSIEYKNVDFDGIFNFFMKETNGRIEDEVNITASQYHGSDVPLNVVKFNENNYFYSNNVKNSWICFEFKKHKVIPTHYTVKSYGFYGNPKPKTWVIEGLNNKQEWKTIDNEVDCPYLKDNYAYHTFSIQNEQKEEFKSIKMRLTGPVWRGDDVLLIHSFELYGDII